MSEKYISLEGLGTYTNKLKSGSVTKTIFDSNIWEDPGTGIGYSNSFTMNSSNLTLKTATDSVIGGIKVEKPILGSSVAINPPSTSADRYYPVQITSSGKAVINIPNESNYTLPNASTDTLGGIKVAAVRSSAINTSQGYTTSDRYYGVEVDSNRKAFVNVPWTDTTPLATNTSRGGIKIGFTTNATNRSYAVQLSNEQAYVHVPWTDTKYTLPNASTDTLGGIKAAAVRSTAINTSQGSTTSDRYYGVEVDSNGKAFVNVPWKNTSFELSTASITELGGIKVAAVGTSVVETIQGNTQGRNYGVMVDPNGKAYVNVPWQISAATTTAYGGIRINYTSDNANRNYGVRLSNGNAYVNVPWISPYMPVASSTSSSTWSGSLSANKLTYITATALSAVTITGFGATDVANESTNYVLRIKTGSSACTFTYSPASPATVAKPTIYYSNPQPTELNANSVYEFVFTRCFHTDTYMTCAWTKYN